MLFQSYLHTASETFDGHKKFRIRFDFLRFRIHSKHFDRKGWQIRKKKLWKNAYKNVGLGVQGPLHLMQIAAASRVIWLSTSTHWPKRFLKSACRKYFVRILTFFRVFLKIQSCRVMKAVFGQGKSVWIHTNAKSLIRAWTCPIADGCCTICQGCLGPRVQNDGSVRGKTAVGPVLLDRYTRCCILWNITHLLQNCDKASLSYTDIRWLRIH